MSTERDIIIERYEQKLAARDKEIEQKIEQMKDSLRETILTEMERRFTEKIKLRESTIDEISTKFGEKINELLEMNKSLRDSIFEQQKSQEDALAEAENRLDKIERRLVELNSAYDGVMKELLDQKSIIQELAPRRRVKEEPKPEVAPKGEVKPPEKPKPKGEYIVAGSYTPQKKQQQIIEAEEKTTVADNKIQEKEQLFKRLDTKRSERIREGVEIFETPKKR